LRLHRGPRLGVDRADRRRLGRAARRRWQRDRRLHPLQQRQCDEPRPRLRGHARRRGPRCPRLPRHVRDRRQGLRLEEGTRAVTAQQLSPGLRRAAERPARQQGHIPLPVTVALRLLVPALILLAWEMLSRSTTSGYFVPGPVESLDTVGSMCFSTDAGRLFLGDATFTHFVPSVARALAGLGLAIAVGVGVGVLLGIFPVLHALFQPLVHVGRSLPSPALLGVFFLLFGIGDSPKVFLIAFSVVWPILFNTIDGVMSVGEIRSQAAAVYKIPARLVLTHIVLPGASPKIFAGIRTAMSMSLIIMIISE